MHLYKVKDGYQNVIGIVKDSQIVAKYVYDAWGNIIREEKDSNDPFAQINPIRYRSYYYDPEIGAFISPFISAAVTSFIEWTNEKWGWLDDIKQRFNNS